MMGGKVSEIPERLWTIEDVATFLQMEPESVENLIYRHAGPPSYKPTGKRRGPRYFIPEEVMAWVREHPADTREVA